MAATKFRVTITMEVKDIGNVPADSSVLNVSIQKAVENISPGNITTHAEVEKIGRTGVKPRVVRHEAEGLIDDLQEVECECGGEDEHCSECDGTGYQLN